MKYFFDFDYTVCNHAFIVLLVAIGLAKLLFFRISDELQDGLLTVKEDLRSFRSGLMMLNDRWENSEVMARITGNVREITSNIMDKLQAGR